MSIFQVAVDVLHSVEVEARTPREAEDIARSRWETLPCLNTEIVDALVTDGDMSDEDVEEEA